MKMRHTLLVVGLMGLLVATGCAHPLIDTWADRGIVGVRHGQQNIIEFRDKIQEVLNNRKSTDVDALFRDILDVSQGRIKDANGLPVELDEEWLTIHANALKLLIKLWEVDQDTLDDATAKAISNLNQVVETFEQIKRLRRAWGDWDAVQVQISQLSGLVQQLILDRSK